MPSPAFLLSLPFFLSACASLAQSSPGDAAAPTPAEPVAAAERTKLDADTPMTTPDGARFVAPRGWSFEPRGRAIILTPEGDSNIALVDVVEVDANVAVEAAWEAVNPPYRWPLKLTTDRPGSDGWDSIRVYNYETPPSAHRYVAARASKRGDAYTVLLFDMDVAVLGKRRGEAAKIVDRLLPPAYERESFAGGEARHLNDQQLQQLQDFVELGRKTLGIPGVGLGLYQNGEIVFAGGFGVRALDQPEPIDEHTMFMVASNTKSMATLLLATLVEEGKFTWDTPVIDVMPSFKLGDPDTTKQVQIKHLVCACTGMPRQDYELLLESEDATAASTMELLGTFQPTSAFGEMFQYSNLLASAGGYVAAHAIYPDLELGDAFDRAMQERIFDPIGMKSTTFDFDEAMRGNYAAPYGWNADAKTTSVEMAANFSVIPFRPAGGAWSNVSDMMKYLRMELAKGRLPGGAQIASEADVVARREPQIAFGNDSNYGMGLEVDHKWGIPVVHHGGSLFGYKSDMMYLPDHDVAAVILVNSDEGYELVEHFRRRLLEVLFDGNPEAVDAIVAGAENLRASVLEERQRLTIPAAPPVGSVAGRYVHPALGEIEIKHAGDDLWFDFGGWRAEAASRENDDGTTSLVTISPGFIGFNCVIGESDGNRTLTARDAQHEYVFVEVK